MFIILMNMLNHTVYPPLRPSDVFCVTCLCSSWFRLHKLTIVTIHTKSSQLLQGFNFLNFLKRWTCQIRKILYKKLYSEFPIKSYGHFKNKTISMKDTNWRILWKIWRDKLFYLSYLIRYWNIFIYYQSNHMKNYSRQCFSLFIWIIPLSHYLEYNFLNSLNFI